MRLRFGSDVVAAAAVVVVVVVANIGAGIIAGVIAGIVRVDGNHMSLLVGFLGNQSPICQRSKDGEM